MGIELTRRDAGAHDIQPIEGRFTGDGLGVASVVERLFGDVELEVLGHLVLADDFPDPHPDAVFALEAALVACSGGDDGVEQRFGGLQQGLTLRCPLGGQLGVATHHQPLAGVGIAADFDQVALIEHR